MKTDEQPDMIMMTRYADLDLNESPVVVLGCGHFFTTETLDGHVGLKDVYMQDPITGTFHALKESSELAPSVPQCPNCRSPIKQYVTQRYNRAINQAVIDEMSKRFIVNGQQQLQQIETQLSKVESDLNKSRKSLIPDPKVAFENHILINRVIGSMNGAIASRYKETISLINEIMALQRRMATQHEPGQKLHQAIVHHQFQGASLDAAMQNLSLSSSAGITKGSSDMRVTYGARLLDIKAHGLLLEDKFEIASNLRSKFPGHQASLSFWGGSPTKKTAPYLKDCESSVADCITESLPKLAVEATLYYARIAQLFGSSGLANDTERACAKAYRDTAKHLLQNAEQLCEHKFRDRDTLRQAIGHANNMLSKEFYETVSQAEMDMIKTAMVSGRGGLATHSGQSYSLQLASAVCLCSLLVVLNAGIRLVARIILLLLVLRVRRIWSVEFALFEGGLCAMLGLVVDLQME